PHRPAELWRWPHRPHLAGRRRHRRRQGRRQRYRRHPLPELVSYDTCYRVHYTGTYNVETDGTYYFRLPNADAAFLDFDRRHAIFGGFPGDTDLNGTVNPDDVGMILFWNFYGDTVGGHTWQQGDSTGDGFVNGSDVGAIIGNWGHTVAARV